MKRPPADETHPYEPPAKKQSKWSAEENELIIRLRGDGMKWDDVSRHLPGRSAISCRLHYQNFLERRPDWDEEKKNKLARLYERFRREMWERVARELRMPWRAAEDMHWQLGKTQLAERAGVQPFLAAPDPTPAVPAAGIPITTSFVPTTAYQSPIYATSPHTMQLTAPYSQPPLANLGAHGYGYQPPPPGYVPYQAAPPSRPLYGSPNLTAGPQPPSQPHPPTYLPPEPNENYQSGPPPSQRPHRSVSSTTHPSSSSSRSRPRPSSPSTTVSTSPRRRALSTSRLAAAGMPTLEPRAAPTPPPPLPPLPREYYSNNPQDVGQTSGQGQRLPPVRFLTEESVGSRTAASPTSSAHGAAAVTPGAGESQPRATPPDKVTPPAPPALQGPAEENGNHQNRREQSG